ncbi:hypothetical protein [Planctomicrobium piriforme]|uniref:Uncharacterized protein n=1 Tax=Planctomicrobium piriforme TaxID=1576369 RepID=A0A1I3EBS9_9PLAN|nr:hypothetical protein [Planctomicrobium piriforme]SFH96339.1 hypothetical protein SAMN05421753_104153 [Planctomicrobium piriforme]
MSETNAQPLLVKNVSGETIPARSFVRVTGGEKLANGVHVLLVDKPNDDTDARILVTDLVPIAADKVKRAWNPTFPVWVKPADVEALEPVQEVGPAAGEWDAASDGTGFDCVMVDEDAGLALVIAKGGGSSGGDGGGSSACSPCAGQLTSGLVEYDPGDGVVKLSETIVLGSEITSLFGLDPIDLPWTGGGIYAPDDVPFTCPEEP